MIAYLFRFIDKDGDLSPYVGLTTARSESELFWAIDEFENPYSAVVARVSLELASLCCKIEGEDLDIELTELELGEHMRGILIDSHQWMRPKWSRNAHASNAHPSYVVNMGEPWKEEAK